MRDLKNKLTSGKNTKNIQNRKGKSFGYQVLGFGAGGSGTTFLTATGGTITEVGDFKLHTFTGPGTFTVCAVGDDGLNVVDYIIVAGGGAAGSTPGTTASGGGGAGGFRGSANMGTGAPGAPRTCGVAQVTVTATGYPIVIGGGGAANPGASGSAGGNSTALGLTATGGGFGSGTAAGNPGGSGGGTTAARCGGIGNTPTVSPAQGTSAADASPSPRGGTGGGGALTSSVANCTTAGSPGGAGVGLLAASVGPAGGVANPSPDAFRYYGGGGGASIGTPAPLTSGSGGLGGGGRGNEYAPTEPCMSGVANTGGGSGGGHNLAGTGGSGVVVIRYQFQ